jgi:SAM-dependent methyltransferase
MPNETPELPWWSPQGGFFGSLYLEADDSVHTFFDGISALDERTAREIDGVERLCGLMPGMYVLDCPCGYGRHSVELARRGYDVVGVDINPYFLSLARERAEQSQLAVDFYEADMRDLPELRPVQAVINMFYSFGFFSDADDDLRVLKGFRGQLVDHGCFLMHTMITVPAFQDGRIPAVEVRELRSGRRLRSARRFDPESRREIGAWSIVTENDGEQALPTYSVRIYTPDEFEHLCRQAGFADVRFYGDWDGSPYRGTSSYLLAVAVA